MLFRDRPFHPDEVQAVIKITGPHSDGIALSFQLRVEDAAEEIAS